MKLNIKQIRELLKENNYLFDKSIDISSIKTGRTYKFICEQGHVFDSLVSNVFQSGKFGCPICSGRRVLKGFNDLWTTHPEYAQLLKNKDDGYKYSFGSNVKLCWVCPDCNNEIIASLSKIICNKHICPLCNSDTSYPEKFISNLLDQLCIYYKKEKIFEWSNNKRYDFYLPRYDCIIETHGKQHYTKSDFAYCGGKTYEEEQFNDNEKLFLAKEYGKISNYIVLDCRKSDANWIKCSILQSGLLDILQILPYTVDWIECDKFATSNLTKSICEAYERGEDIKSLCKTFNMSHNSIKSKLKHGSRFNWCTYNPKEAQVKAHKRNGQRIIETMSKPVIQMDMDGNKLNEFPSIQEAQRKLEVSHVWDCIKGKRKSAGGYKWRYKYESE